MNLLIDSLREAQEARDGNQAGKASLAEAAREIELQPLKPAVEQTPQMQESSQSKSSRKTVFIAPPSEAIGKSHAWIVLSLAAGIALGLLISEGLDRLRTIRFQVIPKPSPITDSLAASKPVKAPPFEAAAPQANPPLGNAAPPKPPFRRQALAQNRPATRPSPRKTTRQAPVAEPPQTTLNLERTPRAPRTNRLQAAFEAFSKGRLQEAGEIYRQILSQDPKNAEALEGLGEIALQAGLREEALQYFRQALSLDPRHASARAQILAFEAEHDSQGAEPQLQGLVTEQPDSAGAHFALGNLHARQSRWKEAQEAFFNAHSLDSGNPDILYNLAISLEHLRHPELARRFYEQAADAALDRVAGFSPEAARLRATTLSHKSPSKPLNP